MSEGFDGLDFTVGEVPREGPELFKTVEPIFLEDRSEADIAGMVDGVAGLRVGVADLGPDFATTGRECLEEGVDERGVGLTGVEDLASTATGLDEGSNVALDVGVEAREGFDFAYKEGGPEGVAALRIGFRSSDDEGILLTVVQHSTLADEVTRDALSLRGAVISQVFSSSDFKVISSPFEIFV